MFSLPGCTTTNHTHTRAHTLFAGCVQRPAWARRRSSVDFTSPQTSNVVTEVGAGLCLGLFDGRWLPVSLAPFVRIRQINSCELLLVSREVKYASSLASGACSLAEGRVSDSEKECGTPLAPPWYLGRMMTVTVM